MIILGTDMLKYILKRILMMIPVILMVILVVFLMLNSVSFGRGLHIHVFQGDLLDSVFRFLHIGDNWLGQYLRYSYNVFTKFDLGLASETNWKVSFEVSGRIIYTLRLTVYGLLAVILIGVPLGIVSAIHVNKWQDRVISVLSLFFSSIPNYCLAIFLVFIFSLWLEILPPMGITSWVSYILPVAVISMEGIAQTVRMTRSIVLETLDKQFVTALRSKGISERNTIYKHVLRNSLVPIVSLLSQIATKVLCGTIIVETFFSIPGIGQYLIAAVRQRSYARILGSSVMIAALLMIIDIIADVLYLVINPAVRANVLNSSGKQAKTNA